MSKPNIAYDRPFRTYDEMLDLLSKRNKLKIPDREFALEALSTMSYYDLVNGYKECFMDKYEHYHPDITLEYLFTFHHFDRSIQNILFKYSVYVEKIYKTKLSYLLAENFGVSEEEYLNPDNFTKPYDADRAKKLKETLLAIRKVFINNTYIENPTRHYCKTKNHIPPWILFKNVNFNTAIDLYGFLKSDQKTLLAAEMIKIDVSDEYRKELLKISLTIVRKYRNKIAHNLKFVTHREYDNSLILKEIFPSFKDTLLQRTDFAKKRGRNDPYSMILSIVILLNNPYLTKSFFMDIAAQIKILTSQETEKKLFSDYCRITGLPYDLISRFDKYIQLLEK